MPSFDIVSKTDFQRVENAVNTAKKELLNRYDLKDELCLIDYDKKQNHIRIEAKQEMALETLVDILLGKFSKQQLDVRILDLSNDPVPSGKIMYRLLKINEGIDKEKAKKMIGHIKTFSNKLQPAIHEDQIRVSGKKIDDLQELIAELRQQDFDIPLQFENFRS